MRPAAGISNAPRPRRYNAATPIRGALRGRSTDVREPSMTAIRERLVDEFVSVLSEAETLLKKAGTETGERAQVEAKLLAAKLRLQELEGDAVDRAKEVARYTDDYVHHNPWRAIGVAAAVGFVAGLMMNRR